MLQNQPYIEIVQYHETTIENIHKSTPSSNNYARNREEKNQSAYYLSNGTPVNTV